VSTIPLTTWNPEPRTIFLRASTDSSTTKPSRKRQLPRVTNQPLAWWFPSATKRSKPWCNALETLNLTKNTTTKSSEWERGERELYKGVWTFKSAKRDPPTPGLEYKYSTKGMTSVPQRSTTVGAGGGGAVGWQWRWAKRPSWAGWLAAALRYKAGQSRLRPTAAAGLLRSWVAGLD
jgi:hypothetical protein